MTLDENWFSEAYPAEGVAFSVEITGKLHEERSDYQHIEVYDTRHWGRLMAIDGCIMLTGRDNFIYHEMMTHPALFTHAAPRDVLIIGGGDCGTLREVLRHPGVGRATQVEIDPAVTRAAERFFPELCEANTDPRAELRFADGVAHLRDTPAESLDVVIIDSTDPVGIAEGLFGPEFLTDVHRALRPGGVMVQQSESPLLHLETIIADLHAALERAGFHQRQTLPFPLPSYPGGWWSATLSGKDCDPRRFRVEDAAARPFGTRYYNEGIHQAALAAPEFCRGVFASN